MQINVNHKLVITSMFSGKIIGIVEGWSKSWVGILVLVI